METLSQPAEIEAFNEDLQIVFNEWKLEEETRDKNKFDSKYQEALDNLISSVMESKGYQLEIVVLRKESTGPGTGNSKDVDEFRRKEDLGNNKFRISVQRYGYEIGDPKRPWINVFTERPGLAIKESTYTSGLFLVASEIESMKFVLPEEKDKV